MVQIVIKTLSTFGLNDVPYLSLLDECGVYWLYLKPIFKTGQKCNAIRNKYPSFRFQQKKDFEAFSYSKFPRILPTALFLHFEDFGKIAVLEKKEEIWNAFTNQITNHLRPQNEVVTSTVTVPRKAFVYLAHFPTLKLGKFGLTQNIRDRKNSLKQEYCKEARIVFEETSDDAPKVEKKMTAWLRSQNALISEIPNKKTLSKETFDLAVVSLEQARKFIENLVLTEKASLSSSVNLDQILSEKIKTNDEFALKVYDIRMRHIMQAIHQSLSLEEKKAFFQNLLIEQLKFVSEETPKYLPEPTKDSPPF